MPLTNLQLAVLKLLAAHRNPESYVGGSTPFWLLPSFQSGVPGAYSTSYRNVPDVALNADPNSAPYSICVGGTCNDTVNGTTLIGGTSAAAPLWASLAALINQSLASAARPPSTAIPPLPRRRASRSTPRASAAASR